MIKKKQKIFSFVRWMFIIMFVIGIVTLAIFPFDNRNLELEIVTDSGSYTRSATNSDIADGGGKEFVFDGLDSLKIKKIKFYGSMKSVLLKELSFGGVAPYVATVDQGEMKWEDDGIVLTGVGKVRFIMTDDYVEMLQELSASCLQERLILMGFWLAIIAIGMIVCTAVEEKKKDNWNNHGPLQEVLKFVGDIKSYGQYMVYAAKADMKAEVADSYLNRLWWLLEPFFNMLVYVIVFSGVMGSSIENYATFVFSALLMWGFFNKTVGYSVKLVRTNKDIVTKVYIPKFVLLISNMILNMFKLLFSLIVLVVMMVVFRVEIGVNLFWILPAYLVMILLAFGIGMIFLHFGVYVDDLSYAVGILLNMLMFLSGIFYDTMTTLPDPLNAILMCLNPAAMFVDTMRNALLNNAAANLPILGMWLLLSVILCCIGVHIVYKNENSYVKVV